MHKPHTGQEIPGLSRVLELPQLPVVKALKEHQRRYSADEGEKHVPLGVPYVALRAQEGLSSLSGQ